MVHQFATFLLAGDAQALVDPLGSQLACGGAGALVEKTQAVTHTAVGKAGNDPGSGIIQVDVLLVGNVLQSGRNILLADPAEGKPLAPGENGGRNLVQLRSGQDKQQMLRGLLNDL